MSSCQINSSILIGFIAFCASSNAYLQMPLEIEMEDIIYVSGARTVPSSMPILRGLGGDLDASCDMEIGYDNDADELVVRHFIAVIFITDLAST